MGNVIVLKPGQAPEVAESDLSLESLQGLVGGYIEPVRLDSNAMLLCWEDAKFHGALPSIRCLGTILCGNIVVVGVRGNKFTGLSEALVKKYIAEFATLRM